MTTPGVQQLNAVRLLAVASAKGGTGKSTLALALGHSLATEHGVGVTLLDLDPQAGLTDYAGFAPTDDPLHAEAVIAHGVTLYRSGRALAFASDAELATHVDRVVAAGRLVVADMSPALSDAAHRAVLARRDTLLLLAIRQDAGGITAAGEIAAVAESKGVPFVVAPTFGKRWKVAELAQAVFRRDYGSRVLAGVPEDVRAADAPLHRQPVTVVAPRSRVADAVRELAAQLVAGGLR